MNKIFLIDPPVDAKEYMVNPGQKFELLTPPLWMLCIGSYLKTKKPDINLEMIDGQLSDIKYIKNRILKHKPNYVGITAKNINYLTALDVARFAKKHNSKVIFGGTYVTALAKSVIKNRGINSEDYCVDYVVKGDGEKAFFEIVSGKNLLLVENLVYSSGGDIIENKQIDLDLNSLPQLNFKLFNYNNYYKKYVRLYPQLKKIKIMNLYSQKGCGWREQNKKGCIYCSLYSNKLRIKEPTFFYKEIENCVKINNINYVSDISDLALEDEDWLDEFFSCIKRSKFNSPYFSWNIRAGNISNKKLKKIINIKTRMLVLGIESASQKCLNSLNTGTSIGDMEEGIMKISNAGINVLLRFVLGAPGETEETLKKTELFIKKIFKIKGVSMVVPHVFSPFPNSPAWEMLRNKVGDKYQDKDIWNPAEAQADWIKNYCEVSSLRLFNLFKKIQRLNE